MVEEILVRGVKNTLIFGVDTDHPSPGGGKWGDRELFEARLLAQPRVGRKVEETGRRAVHMMASLPRATLSAACTQKRAPTRRSVL